MPVLRRAGTSRLKNVTSLRQKGSSKLLLLITLPVRQKLQNRTGVDTHCHSRLPKEYRAIITSPTDLLARLKLGAE